MWVAERPYAAAGAALVAASAIAVAPIAAQPSEIPIVDQAMRLVAEDSLLNVPLNLFYDFMNVPYYEVQALDFLSRSLFFSGPWMVVSPTNLWGVDPGDPSHFQSTVNFLFPNPILSGMWGVDNPEAETDFSAGLGQQLWGMMAAVLPVNSACDAADCLPVSPTSPITGIGGLDWFLWLGKMLSGEMKFPLFDNWFKVSFDQLFNGYTFDPAADGSSTPDGLGGGTVWGGFGFPGTGENGEYAWSGDTYTLQPWVPIQNYFEHLMAPPATDGIGGTGLYLPTFEEIGRTLQSFTAAATMAFDPFTPGSPFCPGECTWVTDAHLDYPDLVKMIGDAWPGNTYINEWLAAYAAGEANVPTPEQIQNSIDILQQPFWDFGNPSPPAEWNLGGIDYSSWVPYFYDFWKELGFTLPPLHEDSASDVATLAAGSGDAFTSALNGLLDGSAWTDLFSGIGPDFVTLFGADFATTFGTDLATLFGTDFASTLGFDIASALMP